MRSQSLPIPREVVAHGIGRSGANVKRIEERTGCRVHISTDQESDDNGGGLFWAYAKLHGTFRQIDGAKRSIIGLIYSLTSQSEYNQGFD